MPERVKSFIENKLDKEIKYFTKKYGCKIEIIGMSEYLIPDYKIELLSKNKKVLNLIGNIDAEITKKDKKGLIKKIEKSDDKNKKKKLKKGSKIDKPRTLWVRKKKAS